MVNSGLCKTVYSVDTDDGAKTLFYYTFDSIGEETVGTHKCRTTTTINRTRN